MIEFEHVNKSFGLTQAVQDVSFHVSPGQITGILGPNGSGKTTCLRMVLNLFPPDAGGIRVMGRAPSETVSDQIGYLPEERGLYRRMTTRGVLQYYAKLKGHRIERKHVTEWLRRLGIEEHAERRIGELSKGTAQKVQFIATVLHRPQLLILDEPFSGLDPVSAEVLRGVLSQLVTQGSTVLLSTHDMHLAESLCDHFLMLHKGQKVLDLGRRELDALYSRKTLKITTSNPLESVAEGSEILDFGNYAELIPPAGIDPHALLARICAAVSVERCEISRPSLHDIFLRLAGS